MFSNGSRPPSNFAEVKSEVFQGAFHGFKLGALWGWVVPSPAPFRAAFVEHPLEILSREKLPRAAPFSSLRSVPSCALFAGGLCGVSSLVYATGHWTRRKDDWMNGAMSFATAGGYASYLYAGGARRVLAHHVGLGTMCVGMVAYGLLREEDDQTR
mmetsp:Transcript_6923/g.14956  ORF Transcript_6923/g.14956 Transcript_6923/m.14956 type:complete len:156 (-) Transcript_6923:350-817(-)